MLCKQTPPSLLVRALLGKQDVTTARMVHTAVYSRHYITQCLLVCLQGSLAGTPSAPPTPPFGSPLITPKFRF